MRFFEFGILSRKLLELLLSEITNNQNDNYVSLFEYINELKKSNMAVWMITYLHTLRIFGNFVAHDDKSKEIPSHMDKNDIVFFAQALNRFLEFYLNFKSDLVYRKIPTTPDAISNEF